MTTTTTRKRTYLPAPGGYVPLWVGGVGTVWVPQMEYLRGIDAEADWVPEA